MNNLIDSRNNIDLIDEQIENLLNKRAKVALEIGAVKKAQDPSGSCYVPERENAVLENVLKRNQGPLTNEELQRIYRQILCACRNIQRELKISFLGPQGTFSHAAAVAVFGDAVTINPCLTLKEVLRKVQNDESDFGVVPIENSSEGVVKATLDSLIEMELTVCSEVQLPIHHYLLSCCSSLEEINQVYSHPQALMQCQMWLERNLPNAAIYPAKSSAQACMLAASEKNTAAIAGELALVSNKLNVLAKYLEDEPNNTTRFYVVGKQDTKPTGKDKTSLLATTAHTSGALAKLLNIFAANDINLTLLHSNPSKQKLWQYYFFIEMEGHKLDDNIQQALLQLQQENVAIKLLGSFPQILNRWWKNEVGF